MKFLLKFWASFFFGLTAIYLTNGIYGLSLIAHLLSGIALILLWNQQPPNLESETQDGDTENKKLIENMDRRNYSFKGRFVDKIIDLFTP